MSPARLELTEALWQRREEIERATLARVYGVADPASVEDPAYVEGLRAAVASGVEYALGALEAPRADPLPGPVPAPLLSQARYAARSGVSLDTVLRRYAAAHSLLADFIVGAADEVAGALTDLRRALRAEAALVDRLLGSVCEEYAREVDGRLRGAERRRAERVRMLLDGEPVDVLELGYELEGWHIGAVAAGPGAKMALRELATALDRALLVVRADPHAIWAWLGGRRRVCATQALEVAQRTCSPEVCLALGESGEGLGGWRLTHRQARAAFPIAARRPPNLTLYADVALLASALQDELLASSLRETYILPLESEPDGGRALRQTLRAYIAAGKNVSSTAAALGIGRQTVTSRVALAEEKIGFPVDLRATEIETALRLDDLAER